MDNKLSELSKPVQIFKHPSGRNFWSVSADSNAGHQGVEPFYSQEYVSALLDVAIALREWIDAVPDEVAAGLPTMPGIDRDWVDSVIGKGNRNG